MFRHETIKSRVSSIRHLSVPYIEQDPNKTKVYFHHVCFNEKFRKVSPEELRIIDTAVDKIIGATTTVQEEVADIAESEEEDEEEQEYDDLNYSSNALKAPISSAIRSIAQVHPRLSAKSSRHSSQVATENSSRAASPKLPETGFHLSKSGISKLNIGSVHSIASPGSDTSHLQTNVAISNTHAGLDAAAVKPPSSAASSVRSAATPLSRNQLAPPEATVPFSTSFATNSSSSSTPSPSPRIPSTPDELISLRAKLALLLAPSSRQSSTFETHVFSFSIPGNISSYNVLYPVEPEPLDTVTSNMKFEHELCELLSCQKVDGKTLDAILSVISTVMVMKGNGWFNIGIKVWSPVTYAGGDSGGDAKNREDDPIKVMFTIAKLGDGKIKERRRFILGDKAEAREGTSDERT